ncbi:MAG TPA: hypothetical protein VF407_03515 [Polyangiaceae bacterium]
MRSLRFALTAFGLLPVALAVACSSSSSSGGDTNTDSGTDTDSGSIDSGNGDGAIADAGPIYDEHSVVVASEQGGFTAGALDGSTCQPIDTTYTYDLGSKSLTWKVCAADDAGIASYATGTRTLSSAEDTSVRAKLDAVAVTTEKVACATDAPTQSITIQEAGSTAVTYYDESENCLTNSNTYASGVGEVVVTLADLAHD